MTGAATHGRRADPVLEGSGVKGIDASPLPAGERAVARFPAGWDHEDRRSTLGAA